MLSISQRHLTIYAEYKSEAPNKCKFEKNEWRQWQEYRLYFSVIVTLTIGAIKYHGKVILTRERTQV